ncbi:hypothetical protein [Miltoncostaea marina]|uniref:hypothetical protein n=1 Tax=Miltoncostaea marina TaxID=2843215 RepID=UPI001C3DC9A0|nr:hypothetical protein [Miltoncostaea marina]
MSSVSRILRLCLLALALAACGAGAATAQSAASDVDRVFLDYAQDRSIDGAYSAGELRAALERTGGDAAYRDFERAVQRVFDRDILGLSDDGPSGAGGASGLELPEPQAPGDQPPWPLLALTGLAGALVLAGVGSTVVRRARR